MAFYETYVPPSDTWSLVFAAFLRLRVPKLGQKNRHGVTPLVLADSLRSGFRMDSKALISATTLQKSDESNGGCAASDALVYLAPLRRR